jgi:hypothetical protein
MRNVWRRRGAAARGIGPLLQRDYWTVVAGCRLRPSEVVDFVARRFTEFPPADRVVFTRGGGAEGPLTEGEELGVRIRMAGKTRVSVLHRDRCSFTLGTAEDHPESGRITFGAYRNGRGDVIFHIRSRARSRRRTDYAGFLALGNPMQTTTWTDFVDRVAVSVGEGPLAFVHAETTVVPDEDADRRTTPTFRAEAD